MTATKSQAADRINARRFRSLPGWWLRQGIKRPARRYTVQELRAMIGKEAA